MRQFVFELFALFDKQDKKKFFLLVSLLFINGILGLAGIAAVIPFMKLLLEPDQLTSMAIFSQFTYQQAVGISVVALIAAFWLKNAVAFVVLFAQARILFNVNTKLAKRLFHTYMTAPYYWHLQRSTPQLIRNINNETNMLASYIIQPFGSFLSELISCLVVFGVLLYINFVFSLTVGVFLCIALLLFTRFTRTKAKYYAEQRALAWAGMTKQVMQGLGGIKETKVYQRESYYLDSFNKEADKTGASGSFSTVYQQASRFLIESTAIAVILTMIFIFVLLGYTGQTLFVLMAVFGVASIQLLPSANRLMLAYSQMKYGRPALRTIFEELVHEREQKNIVKQPADTKSADHNILFKEKIVLENLNFSYGNEQRAISDINLLIEKGQTVAFVGSSGAGKTTLVDLILGLHQPNSGKILVDNVEIINNDLYVWQKHFGYIPQQIYLYDGTVRENVAVGLVVNESDDNAIWAALESAKLKKFVENLPDQLDAKVGENGICLSGGQRQRIGIARALYRNPNILVMDEATAALDSQTEKEVTEALNDISKDITVIIIAHRFSTIKNCDKIFVLDNGRLISQGTYQELAKTCNIFSNMVHITEGHAAVL